MTEMRAGAGPCPARDLTSMWRLCGGLAGGALLRARSPGPPHAPLPAPCAGARLGGLPSTGASVHGAMPNVSPAAPGPAPGSRHCRLRPAPLPRVGAVFLLGNGWPPTIRRPNSRPRDDLTSMRGRLF
jgi:hypothetical protein